MALHMVKDERYALVFIYFFFLLKQNKPLFFSQKPNEGQATFLCFGAMSSQTDVIHSHMAEKEKVWNDFHIFYTITRNDEPHFSTYSQCFDPDIWLLTSKETGRYINVWPREGKYIFLYQNHPSLYQ